MGEAQQEAQGGWSGERVGSEGSERTRARSWWPQDRTRSRAAGTPKGWGGMCSQGARAPWRTPSRGWVRTDLGYNRRPWLKPLELDEP